MTMVRHMSRGLYGELKTFVPTRGKLSEDEDREH